VQHGFLNEVPRIQAAARGGRQPPVRPAPKARKAALEQRLHGFTVAAARLDDQLDGRLVAQQRVGASLVGLIWFVGVVVGREGHIRLTERNHKRLAGCGWKEICRRLY
jgi:hypothetical protein